MTDYIKKAVELADGWSANIIEPGMYIGSLESKSGGLFHPDDQEALDALAAQLVRQVDNSDGAFVETDPTRTTVRHGRLTGRTRAQGPDRTMNSIRAIVDSGVLEHE